MIQNGRLLNRDITTAAFGVVGISGDCDKQQSSSPSSSVSSEDNNVIGTIGSSSSSNNRNDFAFTEFLEVSPNLKGVVMSGPTNRFVDDGGTLHIVGELRNDGIRTVNVFHMVATLYGPNNKTLGLDYANPTPALLSPGQNASFELFVGGESAIDGISDLGQITKVKYHVGY